MSQHKRRKPNPARFLNILVLIIVVLVVFEGKLLMNIFSDKPLHKRVNTELEEVFAGEEFQTETEPSTETPDSEPQTEPESTPETEAPVSKQTVDSPSVVQAQATAVDDSFFEDAVFIGDSRMEGFRIQSGITKGTFLTGVGMDCENIFTTPFISTPSGQITVYQGLYKANFKKVYILLGTNELGWYDWNDYEEKFRIAVGEIKKQIEPQEPNVQIYVMGVPYVEEAKVTTGEYVNNDNVDALNERILNVCEKNGYHYLDLNEVLSDGNHSLIEGASVDGVHILDTYSKIWLDYLKTHYVTVSESTVGGASGPSSIETESETSGESESETSTESESETSESAE